jgi:hypothetical protein
MSLHLGNDFVISSRQVVSVLNIQRSFDEESNKPQDMRWAVERVRKIGQGPFRSAVLCAKGTIYYSSLDSLTLARRLLNGNKLSRLVEEENGKNVQRG